MGRAMTAQYEAMPDDYGDLSLYYLGVCDDLLGDRRAATEGLARFLANGAWKGAAAYKEAEERIARLDPNGHPSVGPATTCALFGEVAREGRGDARDDPLCGPPRADAARSAHDWRRSPSGVAFSCPAP